MRRVLIVLAAAAGSFLVGGVAEAQSETYEVSKSWELTYVDGSPTVRPPIEDDVVEVSCRGDDTMTDWTVNDRELVAEAFPLTDGTGIQVQPRFADESDGPADPDGPDDSAESETLTVTVTCERS
jgi:hypothetical protein